MISFYCTSFWVLFSKTCSSACFSLKMFKISMVIMWFLTCLLLSIISLRIIQGEEGSRGVSFTAVRSCRLHWNRWFRPEQMPTCCRKISVCSSISFLLSFFLRVLPAYLLLPAIQTQRGGPFPPIPDPHTDTNLNCHLCEITDWSHLINCYQNLKWAKIPGYIASVQRLVSPVGWIRFTVHTEHLLCRWLKVIQPGELTC